MDLSRFDQEGYNVGDTVMIEVIDGNATGPFDVTVDVTSGDSELVTLTDNGSGAFTGMIATASGSPTSGDGTLQVAIANMMTVTYVDLDDGNGNTVDRTDTANIRNIVEYESTDIPVDIIDNTTVTSIIDIADAGTVADVDVTLDITHTWDSDLDVFLIAPDSTRIELFQDVGGSGDNFVGTILDDEASTSISSGTAPFTGSFSPTQSLGAVDGISMTGIWTLEISDDAGGDTGTLDAWSLLIDVIPAIPDLDVTGPASPVAEGNTGSTDALFEITLSEASSDTITVDYATTIAGYANPATPGVDFVEVVGTATFNPGDLTVQVMVPVNGDQFLEGNEQFGLELSAPANALINTGIADATIGDDDLFSVGTVMDFGPAGSSVISGGIGVHDVAYDASTGARWVASTGQGFFERSRGNALIRDFARVRTGEFAIDVPNDTYDVTVHYGVVQKQDGIEITFESDTYPENLNNGPNVTKTYQVVVADGQLNILFDGGGGLNNTLLFSGIEVNSAPAKYAPPAGWQVWSVLEVRRWR